MAKCRESAYGGRIVKKMSKEEFISYDRSIPIRNAIKKEDLNEPKGNNSLFGRLDSEILCNEWGLIIYSDFQIKTDTRVWHENGWEDVKKCAQIIRACINDEDPINWEKIGIKIGTNERPNNHKGDETTVEFPGYDFLKNDENDTSGYLVMVSKENIIMPRYLDFIFDKISAQRGQKGKKSTGGLQACNFCFRDAKSKSALPQVQQEIWFNLYCHSLKPLLPVCHTSHYTVQKLT